jgi:predicted peptidase
LFLLCSSLALGPKVCAQANDLNAENRAELVVPRVSQRFSDLFDSRAYRYTGGVYDDRSFPYRLFVPEIHAGQRYPLVVWLHGHGEAGSENAMHLAWLGERMMLPPWKRSRFPFFVLCVPCPIDNDFWLGFPEGTVPEDRSGSDMISVTDAILTDLLKNFPVDTGRIYVTGVSSGGTGSWQYALKYPARFAAVAPLAGGRIHGDFTRISNIPVWVFHSTHDTGTPVDGTRENVAQLRAAGGWVKLTEVDTVSHDCWTSAFAEHHLLDWMLAQRRGGPVIMEIRPWWQRIADSLGHWTVGQAIGQVAVLGMIAAGGLEVLRWVRRKRRSRVVGA